MKVLTYRKKSFDGGLNDTVTPRELKDNECNPLRNWDIRFEGELRRRDGLTQVGDTPSAVPEGIHGFARTNGNNDLLIMDDGSLKYLNGSVFSQLDNGFTAGKDFSFETVSSLNRVYITNEDNTTHYWDRSATAGAVGTASFTGAGLNDATFGGTYIGGGQTYKVEIDGAGTPDTFRWSDDGGSTWNASTVAITGTAQTLSNGVTVTFGATTGHTATEFWTSACTSVLTDLGDTCYNANKVVWFKNHLFFLNNLKVGATSYADWVGFSDFNAPDTHDTTNARFQVPGKGRIITAVDLGDSLVLFKEHSIQFLQGYGETSWAITASSNNVANLSESVGCIAINGACRVGDEVWFIDDEAFIRRITRTDFDAFRQDVISTKVQGSLNELNKSQLQKVAMWTNDSYVYVSYPSGASTVNDTVLRYDLIASRRTGEEAWTKITGWSAKGFTDYISSTKVPDLIVLDGTTGKVYKHSGQDDDGVAIDADATDKDDDDKRPGQYKRYRFGEITAEAVSDVESVSIHASVDGSAFAKLGELSLTSTGSHLAPTGTDTLAPTGNFTLAGNTENDLRYYYTSGGGSPTGRRIRHSIRHNATGEQPHVRTYTRYFKMRDPR